MDMRKLQERLAETEAQMTKILAAMQAVQTKVVDVDAPTDKTETSKDVKPEEKAAEKTEDKKVTPAIKSCSNPIICTLLGWGMFC
jgi:hypothetical protein